MIDAHAHYTTEDARAFPPQAIVAKLETAGVRHLVVIGTPPELAQHLYRHAPGRVIPLLGVYGAGLTKENWMRDERIAPDGKLLPAWRALFVRYPDRFLVAVDTFSVNRWQHYEAVVGQIRAWVEPLPPELRRKLLHDNAARLFEGFLRR